MRTLALVAALALPAAAQGLPAARPAVPADGAAIVAATWEVMMYDHVDIRDGEWIVTSAGLDVSALSRQLALILSDPSPSVGVQAAGFLSRIGPKAAGAVPSLADGVLDSRSADLRWACALALGRIGPGARAAASPLISALKDEDPVVRAAAADALGRIGVRTPLARQALKSAARDKDVEVRFAAEKVLSPN